MIILKVILFLIAAYSLLLITAFLLQDKVVFPAGGSIWRTPKELNWEFEHLQLEVDKEITHGWFITCKQPHATILFSHGNGGTISDRLELAEIFLRLNCNVLLYDYGGYGKSSGKPSEKRCYADALVMYDYLVNQKKIPPQQIILFGESLGGGVTVELATKRPCGGVILLATFLSTVQIGKDTFPFLPIKWFLKHRFENDRKITKINAPILIFHSPDDEIVPFYHGQRLFELANEPKHFVKILGGHNDGFYRSHQILLENIKDFLERYVPK